MKISALRKSKRSTKIVEMWENPKRKNSTSGSLTKILLRSLFILTCPLQIKNDYTSQPGHLVPIKEKLNNCNIPHYYSHNALSVTRSVLGGELHALADVFDYGFTTRTVLNNIMGMHTPLKILPSMKVILRPNSSAQNLQKNDQWLTQTQLCRPLENEKYLLLNM